MKRSLAAVLAVCGAAVGALSLTSAQVMADSKNPPTIKDLEGQQVDVNSNPPQGIDTNKTMDSYRRFLD